MKILRTYILREAVLPFFLSLGVLTCIFLLGNLIRLANMVINKGVSIATIGMVFLYYVPFLLGYTLPIACLTAVILTFGRLSADNEIIAIRASGIHLKRLLLPLAVIGILVSLFSVILNDRIIPHAHYEQRKLLKNVGAQNPAALLEPGIFIRAFEDQILFIYRIEGNKLYGVRIYQPQKDGPTRTIIAREGEFTRIPGEDKIKLKLMDGTADEPNLENPDNFYKLRFNKYFMTLDLSRDSDQPVDKKPKSMTLSELRTKIQELRQLFVDATPLETEFYRKISWSFSAMIFILLGFPIAVVTHRREKTANIALAIMLAAFYYLVSLGCEALSMQNILMPAVAMWIPNAAGLGLALFFNYRLSRI